MSSTNIAQVSCLICNLKVEIISAKNIYKTIFAETSENLASFVSRTLSLAPADRRSSYLCLKCFNLFAKLEQASIQVKIIKSEIQKVFIGSYSNEINSHLKTVTKDASTHTEIHFANARDAQIECKQNQSSNSSTEDNIITENSVPSSNLEIKNNYSETNWVEIIQELSQNSQSHEESVTNDDNDSNCPSGSEYQLMHTVEKVLTENKLVSSTKVLSPLQNKTMEFKEVNDSKSKDGCVKNIEDTENCYDLKLHNFYSGINAHKCEICGKVYKNQKSFKTHKNIHNGIQLYTCSICDKSFTQNSDLNRHLPMHTGEKPYECEICPKKFTHHTSFKMHNLSHSKEKRYKCDLCSMAFMSSSHLKRHLRTHGVEKQHTCSECGKSFFERYNLIAHMKVHDPELKRLKEAKRKQK